MTKLLGGLIQKIHQSDRAIAGLIFSKNQTGSVRIRPEIELFKMADWREIEVCKLSPRNKGILVQATKAPTLSLVWTCETIWEDQRKLLNMKTAKSLRTAAELQDFIEEHKSNYRVRKTISIWCILGTQIKLKRYIYTSHVIEQHSAADQKEPVLSSAACSQPPIRTNWTT